MSYGARIRYKCKGLYQCSIGFRVDGLEFRGFCKRAPPNNLEAPNSDSLPAIIAAASSGVEPRRNLLRPLTLNPKGPCAEIRLMI